MCTFLSEAKLVAAQIMQMVPTYLPDNYGRWRFYGVLAHKVELGARNARCSSSSFPLPLLSVSHLSSLFLEIYLL